MDHLDELEAESIFILREAYKNLGKLGMLWSLGKDSTVLLWLVQKAFYGHAPFPFIHIDTSFEMPEVIAYRDKMAADYNIDLIAYTNQEALDKGMNPKLGRLLCCGALKTTALNQVSEQYGFDGLIVGARQDEEASRSKERIFSERDKNHKWDYTNQPPELWDEFKTDFPKGNQIRVHPLLHWTELDIWEYIRRENIPVIDLYFAKNGRRYRSLGCAPCTGTFKSDAKNVTEIIEELKVTKMNERSGRAQDQEDAYAMQKLRQAGYM
ncbi:sulfate adenylyltransferase subunit CysD [Lacticaseibacillus sp. GG6-2]